MNEAVIASKIQAGIPLTPEEAAHLARINPLPSPGPAPVPPRVGLPPLLTAGQPDPLAGKSDRFRAAWDRFHNPPPGGSGPTFNASGPGGPQRLLPPPSPSPAPEPPVAPKKGFLPRTLARIAPIVQKAGAIGLGLGLTDSAGNVLSHDELARAAAINPDLLTPTEKRRLASFNAAGEGMAAVTSEGQEGFIDPSGLAVLPGSLDPRVVLPAAGVVGGGLVDATRSFVRDLFGQGEADRERKEKVRALIQPKTPEPPAPAPSAPLPSSPFEGLLAAINEATGPRSGAATFAGSPFGGPPPVPRPVPSMDFGAIDRQLEALRPEPFDAEKFEREQKLPRFLARIGEGAIGAQDGWTALFRAGMAALGAKSELQDEIEKRQLRQEGLMRDYERLKLSNETGKAEQRFREAQANHTAIQQSELRAWEFAFEQAKAGRAEVQMSPDGSMVYRRFDPQTGETTVAYNKPADIMAKLQAQLKLYEIGSGRMTPEMRLEQATALMAINVPLQHRLAIDIASSGDYARFGIREDVWNDMLSKAQAAAAREGYTGAQLAPRVRGHMANQIAAWIGQSRDPAKVMEFLVEQNALMNPFPGAQLLTPKQRALVGTTGGGGLVQNPFEGRLSVPPEALANGRASPKLKAAVEQQESGGNPNAVSPKGARGPMQTMPATERSPGYGVRPAANSSVEELRRVGHDYLDAMIQAYKDVRIGLAAYNAGPGRVEQWLKTIGDPRTGKISFEEWLARIPYSETRNYVPQVLARLNAQ